MREKYPDFRFNNSSVEATTEDEIYIVASLLLYFVCVNSKDLDIKHAMCSQLSSEDQEIILKFSKCLMECTPVTYKDVLAAINGELLIRIVYMYYLEVSKYYVLHNI